MTTFDHALTYVEGIGHATDCAAYPGRHRPTPMRFIWHHILPLSCGGKTRADNLVSLCDVCHYNTHALMTMLRDFDGDVTVLGIHGTVVSRNLAIQGYEDAVELGTVDKIPNEGGAAGVQEG